MKSIIQYIAKRETYVAIWIDYILAYMVFLAFDLSISEVTFVMVFVFAATIARGIDEIKNKLTTIRNKDGE